VAWALTRSAPCSWSVTRLNWPCPRPSPSTRTSQPKTRFTGRRVRSQQDGLDHRLRVRQEHARDRQRVHRELGPDSDAAEANGVAPL